MLRSITLSIIICMSNDPKKLLVNFTHIPHTPWSLPLLLLSSGRTTLGGVDLLTGVVGRISSLASPSVVGFGVTMAIGVTRPLAPVVVESFCAKASSGAVVLTAKGKGGKNNNTVIMKEE